MRESNKMPNYNRSSKRDLHNSHIFPVTANLDLDDYNWVWEQAKKLKVSKAEIVRRCIRNSKQNNLLLSDKEIKLWISV